MYLLNKWYMQASTSEDFCVGVRIRDDHWFRDDDVMYVDFSGPLWTKLSLAAIACK